MPEVKTGRYLAGRHRMIRTAPCQTFMRDRMTTPIGTMLLVTDDDGALRALEFADYEARMKELLRLHYGAVRLVNGRAPKAMRSALSAYFDGDFAALKTIAWRVA